MASRELRKNRSSSSLVEMENVEITSRTVPPLSQHRHWWDWDLGQGALRLCSPVLPPQSCWPFSHVLLPVPVLFLSTEGTVPSVAARSCVMSIKSSKGVWTVHCTFRLSFSPAHSSGFLGANCFLALFPSLFCCLWIGERMALNLSLLRAVAGPVNLPANETSRVVLSHKPLPLPGAS